MDEFLQKYLHRYETWHDDGKISHSSRVIPVGRSVDAKQWVLPSEQALDILAGAETIALQNCLCRTHYSRCGKPLDVCLILNDMAEKFIAKGVAERISLSEASEVLTRADAHGLVHLSLYKPDHEIFALCNCCACCCHDLQLVLDYHHREMLAHADFIAETSMEQCTGCMACIERCVFGARRQDEDQLVYDRGACLGCGLCVSVCPARATMMVQR